MKNKKLLIILCAVLTLTCVSVFCGCTFFSQFTHDHKAKSESWQKDAYRHWHICKECSVKMDVALHVYGSDDSKTCTVCGYSKTAASDDENGGSGSQQGGNQGGGSGSGNSQGGGSGNQQGGGSSEQLDDTLTDAQLQQLLQVVEDAYQAPSVTNRSYKVSVGVSTSDGEKTIGCNISWAISGTALVTIDSQPEGHEYTVRTPKRSSLENDVSYTLTATLVDGEGVPFKNADEETYTVSFNKAVECLEAGETITDSYIEQNSASDYGYNWLATQTNGVALQAAYDQIDNYAEMVLDGTAAINDCTVGEETYKSLGRVISNVLTTDQLRTVYYTYYYDHPYYYWLENVTAGGTYTSSGVTMSYIEVLLESDYAGLHDIAELSLILNANIKQAYALADLAESDYEATLIFHNALALLSDYTYESPNVPATANWAHSIIGLFDNDMATGPVCEGYARSFQLLLNLKGIPNIYCVGEATNAGVGGGGGHAWNMVQLDGAWYMFDLTWNDANDANGRVGGSVIYNYFAMSQQDKVSNKTFAETHTPGDPQKSNGHFLYDLPVVAATSYQGELLAGKTYNVDGISYMYCGNGEVSVYKIELEQARIVIPEKVVICGEEMSVVALGPNCNGSIYSSIANGYVRTIVLPKSIRVIGRAAFYITWEMNFEYNGTAQEWSEIFISTSAFKPGVGYHVDYSETSED